jgi:hypothetical protein
VIKVNSPTPGIKTTTQPDALDNPSPGMYPKALKGLHWRRVARSVACQWSFYPGVGAILFPTPCNISARRIFGEFYKSTSGLRRIFFDKYPRCSRVAACGAVWPGALSTPWPDQIAHLLALTARVDRLTFDCVLDIRFATWKWTI